MGAQYSKQNMTKFSKGKVHIFWEGHKILQNLHQLFVLCTASQIIGGDFENFCDLIRIYELYLILGWYHDNLFKYEN